MIELIKIIDSLISNSIFKFVYTLGIPFLAAYLAARWSLKKYYYEKWWDKKDQAFKEIVDILYDLLEYCEIKKDDYGDGRRLPQNKLDELQINYSKAYWKLKKATTIGNFILSEKASKILLNLQNREILRWDENPSWDIFSNEYDYYKKALSDIIAISKQDLLKK